MVLVAGEDEARDRPEGMEDAAAVAAVELRSVFKSYGAMAALTDVNLSVRRGEFFSLLGSSGCGKSTTLGIIAGLTLPSSGQVLIDGKSVGNVPAYRRAVNTVFQNYALFPHMNVGENVAFGLKMRKVPADERRVAVRDALRMVSLEGLENRSPLQMSGGQRQRVALARALVNRPSVLLLDEPLGALDLKLRKQMQSELTELQGRVKTTFIYVTHDQEEAMSMSDRIAVMDGGRVMQVGTPDEIYNEPANRKVMEFMGSPNTLSGTVSGLSGNVAVVSVGGSGSARVLAREPIQEGAAVSLLVRPERVKVLRGKPKRDSVDLSGTIVRMSSAGYVIHLTVRLDDGQELVAYRLNNREGSDEGGFDRGERICLSWSDEDGRIYS
jgi:spermidine/putrescine transport system ATP-binding protein